MHDSSTIVNELATGEADATFYADVTRIAALRALPDRRVVVTPVPGFDALIFNLQSALAGDSAVRHAFAMAIDRRQIVGKITHGLYDADTGARGLFTWAWDPNAAQVPYDPAGAAALLDRDGWVRAADGTRMKDGHRLEMQFGFYGGNDIESEFVPLIVEQERAAGITVTAKRYTREMFTALDGPLRRGRFDVALYSYQASYDPDVSWLLSCAQRAPAGFNEARYCNAAVDAALARGETSFDRTTRKRAYADVQRRIAADLPYDFLCQISEIDVIPSWLQGYEPPLLSPYVSVARWH
jgi:peptide/nickel transport system substrate-binding protein